MPMRVKISTNKVAYDLVLERTISVIRGDSGTGKSYMCDLVHILNQDPDTFGLSIESELPAVKVNEQPNEEWCSSHGKSVIFIDEDVKIKGVDKIIRALRRNGCWVVYISRKNSLKMDLGCATSCVYKIEASGKVRGLKRLIEFSDVRNRDYTLCTEDSNSGNQFFGQFGRSVEKLDGNGSLHKSKLDVLSGKILIADLAVLGMPMLDKMPAYLRGDFDVISMDSFEQFLLSAGMFDSVDEVEDVRNNPEKEANNPEFYSWERYYTEKIRRFTEMLSVGIYTKRALLPCFKEEPVVDSVLSRNHLEWLKSLDYASLASQLPEAIRSRYNSDEECVKDNMEYFNKEV